MPYWRAHDGTTSPDLSPPAPPRDHRAMGRAGSSSYGPGLHLNEKPQPWLGGFCFLGSGSRQEMKKTRPCCKCFTKCRRQREAFPDTARPRASSPATTSAMALEAWDGASQGGKSVLKGGKQQSSRRGGQQPPILSLLPHMMQKAASCHKPTAVQRPGASRTLCSPQEAPRGPGFHAGSGLGLCLTGWGE